MSTYLDTVLEAVKLSRNFQSPLDTICPAICGFSGRSLYSSPPNRNWQFDNQLGQLCAWTSKKTVRSLYREASEPAGARILWRLTVQADDFSHLECSVHLIWLFLLGIRNIVRDGELSVILDVTGLGSENCVDRGCCCCSLQESANQAINKTNLVRLADGCSDHITSISSPG